MRTESGRHPRLGGADRPAAHREDEEQEALETFLTVFELVPIDEEIARQSGRYRRDDHKSHNIGLADALIAATAEDKQASLVTFNQKLYSVLRRITVPYRKAEFPQASHAHNPTLQE